MIDMRDIKDRLIEASRTDTEAKELDLEFIADFHSRILREYANVFEDIADDLNGRKQEPYDGFLIMDVLGMTRSTEQITRAGVARVADSELQKKIEEN